MAKHKYTLGPDILLGGAEISREKYYMEEIKQAYTRLIFIAIILPFLVYSAYTLPFSLHPLEYVVTLYIAAALAHLFFIKRYRDKAPFARKIAVILLDTMVTTAIVCCLHAYGYVFSLIYIWIILGNGMRFGPTYLYIAVGASLIGVGTVYALSPYWQMHVEFVVYMVLAIILLPFFMLRLIHRIYEKSRQLEELLAMMEHNALHDGLTGLPNLSLPSRAST